VQAILIGDLEASAVHRYWSYYPVAFGKRLEILSLPDRSCVVSYERLVPCELVNMAKNALQATVPEFATLNSDLLTYPPRNLSASIIWDSLQLQNACEDPFLESRSSLC